MISTRLSAGVACQVSGTVFEAHLRRTILGRTGPRLQRDTSRLGQNKTSWEV